MSSTDAKGSQQTNKKTEKGFKYRELKSAEVCPGLAHRIVLRNLKSLHKHKINHLPQYKHLHQPKMRMRLKMMKEKNKKMSQLKRRAMIKGEMPMIKTRKMNKLQDRHTQESTKQFNEITP
jgi:hypothetical protein